MCCGVKAIQMMSSISSIYHSDRDTPESVCSSDEEQDFSGNVRLSQLSDEVELYAEYE